MHELNPTKHQKSKCQYGITEIVRELLGKRGHESYLGEPVSMTQHMLQTAYLAENAGESDNLIVAALLHDIGHYTGGFDDDYIEVGVDNLHEAAGEQILRHWFPPEVTEPVRWHVDAKRYLCAVEPEYLTTLSRASLRTLALQGGPMKGEELQRFSSHPQLDSILRVRRYDDGGKVPGTKTPDLEHYLEKVQKVTANYI